MKTVHVAISYQLTNIVTIDLDIRITTIQNRSLQSERFFLPSAIRQKNSGNHLPLFFLECFAILFLFFLLYALLLFRHLFQPFLKT